MFPSDESPRYAIAPSSARKPQFVGKDYPDANYQLFCKGSKLLEVRSYTGGLGRSMPCSFSSHIYADNITMCNQHRSGAVKGQFVSYGIPSDDITSNNAISTVNESTNQVRPYHARPSINTKKIEDYNSMENSSANYRGTDKFESQFVQKEIDQISKLLQVERSSPAKQKPLLNSVISKRAPETGSSKGEKSSAENSAQKAVKVFLSPGAQIAYTMIEANELKLPAGYELVYIEKLFISNILNIRHTGLFVDPHLATAAYVEAINESIGGPVERRNDDRFRWIFKRTIRYFLSKYSRYQPTKSHRREDYMPILMDRFFPFNAELEVDLLNSTFASKKKVIKLFRISPLFKEEFLEFINNQVVAMYTEEVQKKFQELYDIVVDAIAVSPEVGNKCILRHHKKRLDWTTEDVTESIAQINKLTRY